ncbi:MAG: hypothetical protein VZS44_10940 [Bacilli bacterium]|nr:hypothetical protein [Bacilli bacterium]
MKNCYENYIESIVNEIQAELKLNKKDIIFDNKYIITLFNSHPVIKNNDYKKTPAYRLENVLKLFLTDDDYIKAIDKLYQPNRTKDLLKATIKYIKSKYDIANKYFD